MLIIHGTRRTERKLGYVADLCPICRTVRPFRLIRLGTVNHFYFISFGAGKHAGEMIVCQACGISLRSETARYAAVERTNRSDIASLMFATFPNLQEVHRERLEVEERLWRGPAHIEENERARLLFEPFDFLGPLVHRRYEGSAELDKPAGLGCFGTILLIVGITMATIYLKGTISNQPRFAIAIIGVLGLVYTFVQIALSPRRYIQSEIIPKLALALAPLQPVEAELARCIETCKRFEWTIAEKVKPRQILAAIEMRSKGMSLRG